MSFSETASTTTSRTLPDWGSIQLFLYEEVIMFGRWASATVSLFMIQSRPFYPWIHRGLVSKYGLEEFLSPTLFCYKKQPGTHNRALFIL